MKTILVLTDLSYKAENAALYALQLAEKAKANLILFQSIKIGEAVLAGEPIEAWQDTDEVRRLSLLELKNLALRLAKHHQPGNFKPGIEVSSAFGELAENVEELMLSKSIDLIVMGAKSGGDMAHLVVGETNTILNKVKCPVMFVPYPKSYGPLKTIVFSSDLKKAYPKAVSFLVDLARIDNADIVITHIGKSEKFNHKECLNLFRNVFEYPATTFKQLPLGAITEQLDNFTKDVKADLTVMIHHEHLLYGEKVPDRSIKMLNNYRLPLLVLPD
jgi:nucleotide-binding universal stress UspA family protein